MFRSQKGGGKRLCNSHYNSGDSHTIETWGEREGVLETSICLGVHFTSCTYHEIVKIDNKGLGDSEIHTKIPCIFSIHLHVFSIKSSHGNFKSSSTIETTQPVGIRFEADLLCSSYYHWFVRDYVPP